MGIFEDLTGHPFGKLMVVGLAPDRSKGVRWICQCSCGQQTQVPIKTSALRSGKTRSCGCLWRETVPGNNATHRRSGDYLYRVWSLMRQRCNNRKNPAYARYGGRGIKVCRRWEQSFERFATDMGERPTDTHELDRRNNNKGYSPQNCYWALPQQQSRNRRSNRWLTLNGETKTVAEWADITGITSWSIRQRIDRYGWTIEKSLTTPEDPSWNHRFFTHQGETRNMKQWSKHLNISKSSLYYRLEKGWTLEQIVVFYSEKLSK